MTVLEVAIDFGSGDRITGRASDITAASVWDAFTGSGQLLLHFQFEDGRTVMFDRDKVKSIMVKEWDR